MSEPFVIVMWFFIVLFHSASNNVRAEFKTTFVARSVLRPIRVM